MSTTFFLKDWCYKKRKLDENSRLTEYFPRSSYVKRHRFECRVGYSTINIKAVCQQLYIPSIWDGCNSSYQLLLLWVGDTFFISINVFLYTSHDCWIMTIILYSHVVMMTRIIYVDIKEEEEETVIAIIIYRNFLSTDLICHCSYKMKLIFPYTLISNCVP